MNMTAHISSITVRGLDQLEKSCAGRRTWFPDFK